MSEFPSVDDKLFGYFTQSSVKRQTCEHLLQDWASWALPDLPVDTPSLPASPVYTACLLVPQQPPCLPCVLLLIPVFQSLHAFQLPTEAQILFRIQEDELLFHCGPLGAYSGLWHPLSFLLLELCLEKNFICQWPLEFPLPRSFVGCFGMNLLYFCTIILMGYWE